MRRAEACLLQHASLPELGQRLGVGDRHGILELAARESPDLALLMVMTASAPSLIRTRMAARSVSAR